MFRKRLNDLLGIVLIHDFDRLLFAGGVGVIKFWIRRRESQRHSGTRAKCAESEDNNTEGEKFLHEAAFYPAYRPCRNRFFQQTEIFSFDIIRIHEAPLELQRGHEFHHALAHCCVG